MPAQPKVSQLTPREIEVLKLIAIGLSTKQIAATLDVSFKTAACHRYRIMDKLDIHETASLTRYAIRQGYIDTGGDSSPGRTQEELFNQVKVTYARYQEALNNYSAFLKERETIGLESTDSSDGARRLRQAERASHAEYDSALLALKQSLLTG